jgi:glycosyltransferase involved in cell wall biosynthesis
MKLLIVTQYFWPENFRINDLALALAERGHHVEVLTGKPNYPTGKFIEGYSFLGKRSEVWNNITIHRAPLISRGRAGGIRLMLNYISFAFFSSIRAFSIKGSFDKILVYEPSPITVGIPAIVMKWRKKADVYFWVQDLWPQSVSAAGGINNDTVLILLDKVTRWIYKKSDKILIQSEGFRKILHKQGVNDNKILYYPNSVESLFQVRLPKTEILNKLPMGFKIMFAGNIGESQDFETIVETAKIIKAINPEIKWVILGDGRKKSFVEEKIEEFQLEKQVFLLGSYPVQSMPDFFACADCLLVSLKRDDIFSVTIPSKIQSYLACGKPILASLDGEGGRIVEEAGAGLVSEAESPQQLAEQVLNLFGKSKEDREVMGIKARNYFEANFERELLTSRLEKIFDSNE